MRPQCLILQIQCLLRIPNRYVVFQSKDLAELVKLKKATYLLFVVKAKNDKTVEIVNKSCEH